MSKNDILDDWIISQVILQLPASYQLLWVNFKIL